MISKHVRSHIRECLYDQFLGDAGGLGSDDISLKLAVVVSLLSKTILQLVTSLTRSICLGANLISHIRECLYDQFLGNAGGLGSGGISLKLVVVVSLLSKTILEMPQIGWRTGITRMPIYSTSSSA